MNTTPLQLLKSDGQVAQLFCCPLSVVAGALPPCRAWDMITYEAINREDSGGESWLFISTYVLDHVTSDIAFIFCRFLLAGSICFHSLFIKQQASLLACRETLYSSTSTKQLDFYSKVHMI